MHFNSRRNPEACDTSRERRRETHAREQRGVDEREDVGDLAVGDLDNMNRARDERAGVRSYIASAGWPLASIATKRNAPGPAGAKTEFGNRDEFQERTTSRSSARK